MMCVGGTLDDRAPCERRPARSNASRPTVVGPLVLALAVLIATGLVYIRLEHAAPVATPPRAAAAPASRPAAQQPVLLPRSADAAVVSFDRALLDAEYSLGVAPGPFGRNLPQGPHFVALPSSSIVVVESEAPLAEAMPAPIELAEAIPLPAPRPSALQILNPREPRLPQPRTMAAVTPSTEEGGFFDRLFRPRPMPTPLAYAAPESGLFGGIGRATFNPTASYDGSTAVYDISAHTVYLPNGTRLEAHSGLGARLDDPRYVFEQNRGPTPPHLYDLQPREQLFHGVAALRLNPVGGGGIFGRTGLLAHTYMLGPNGDSNGCVSFSNYRAFLAAYQRGEIKRLAVVARLN